MKPAISGGIAVSGSLGQGGEMPLEGPLTGLAALAM